jgi:hypothetical protein
MAAPKGIDWLSARKDYIENRKLSYSDISKKYGVSRTVVGQRAKAEDWKMSRKSIDDKVIVKVEGEIVDRNTEINKRHGVAFKNLQQLANAKLTIAYRQIERLIAEKGIDNISIYDNKMISQRDLKDLVEAYTNAINGERVTLGLPTSVERKQVSSRDRKDLFVDDNYHDYVKLLAESLTALEAS